MDDGDTVIFIRLPRDPERHQRARRIYKDLRKEFKKSVAWIVIRPGDNIIAVYLVPGDTWVETQITKRAAEADLAAVGYTLVFVRGVKPPGVVARVFYGCC